MTGDARRAGSLRSRSGSRTLPPVSGSSTPRPDRRRTSLRPTSPPFTRRYPPRTGPARPGCCTQTCSRTRRPAPTPLAGSSLRARLPTLSKNPPSLLGRPVELAADLATRPPSAKSAAIADFEAATRSGSSAASAPSGSTNSTPTTADRLPRHVPHRRPRRDRGRPRILDSSAA